MTKSYDKNLNKDKYDLRDKIDYIKDNIDVHYLIENLGFKIERETSKEIRSSCPIHGGDNRTAFRFNKDKKTWVCFTQKCHELHGNDIIGLVKAVIKTDFLGALEYLKQFVPDLTDVNYIKSKRQREIDKFINTFDDKPIKPKYVDEDFLSKFKTLRSNYFLKEGFENKTLDTFEIAGGWVDSEDILRDIIPIRSDVGELLAYSLRDTRPNPPNNDFKYIITPGFDKQNCLYNMNVAKDYGYVLPIIVVEGFKSVWKLHEYGINNVVAVMGSQLTEGQQSILLSYAMKGVVIMFDNDKAGVHGIERACNDLGDKMDVVPVYIQEIDDNGKGLDPADLTKKQIYEYLYTYYRTEDI